MNRFEVTFGKYKGQTLEEISKNNIGYVMWFADNYQQGTYVGYDGKHYPCKPNEAQKEMISEAKRISEKAKQERKEKYIQEAQDLGANSDFVGSLNKRQDFKLKFIRKQYFASYDYTLFTFLDIVGNVITAYSLNFVPQENESYTIRATPKKHKEYNGVKSTHVNRASIVVNSEVIAGEINYSKSEVA